MQLLPDSLRAHACECRKNLSAMLKDTKTIVGKLERLLGICLQLIFIFFYLAIFNVGGPTVFFTKLMGPSVQSK